jgi:hypothetical protein
MNPTLFRIKVWRITGAEITYPKTNPPQKLMLHEQLNACFTSGPVTCFVSPSRFIHTLEKTLDPTDVGSGILVNTFSHTIYHFSSTTNYSVLHLTLNQFINNMQKLAWNGFCKIALPNKNSNITIVDWLGYAWKCLLEIEGRSPNNCRISGEWRNLCRARRLSDGVTLKFGVIEHSNNTVVHLKISPFIGLRTTLIAPTNSENYKPFYQAEHNFMI